MTKFLFFDIDGTLLGKSRKLTSANIEAIQKAREQGHKTFLCTGRAPVSIVGEVADLPMDGWICSAGGLIKIGGRYVFENAMNPYLLGYVMTLFVNHHVLFVLETKDCVYETSGFRSFHEKRMREKMMDNQELKRMMDLQAFGETRKHVSAFDIAHVGVTKICFVAEDKHNFEICRPFLESYFNIVYFSSPDEPFVNGEIILKNCTKADGIIKVISYFKGQMKDTIAFGDSMNDYEMLREAAIACVYEKASPELLALADYTFKNPDEDGISDLLKQLHLIA